MVEKKCALIIANSEYEDPVLRQLIAPAQDAEALAQVLRDPAISGFEVQTILNEPRSKVEEEIDGFFLDRDRDDLLLLYFSGHGVTDEDGLLYYAARNTHHKRLRSTAVAANFVNDSMTRCRSRRQVLLLDCCHSGAFARTKAGPAVNLGQQFGEAGRGRFILASSGAYQYSFEGDAVEGSAVCSVFTQAIVEGLRTGEADLDKDGLITLDELYDYVHRRVADQTPKQRPCKWAYEVDGSLAIARNPSPSEAPLPDDLQQAIVTFFPVVREQAVGRLDALLCGKHRGLALAAHKALLSLAKDDSQRVANAAEKSLAACSGQIQALERLLRAAAAPKEFQSGALTAAEKSLAACSAQIPAPERFLRAAAAPKEFRSGALTAARVQIGNEFPERGTALLCSSNAREPSLVPQGLDRTMFSNALTQALRQGHKSGGPRLSFSELGDLVKENLRTAYPDSWIRPEVHSLDQRAGDIAHIPLFPNPAYRVGSQPEERERQGAFEGARLEQEERKRQAAVTLAVLLGASTFPKAPKLAEGRAFYNSAADVRDYLSDEQGLALPRQNILSLFDDSHSASEQLVEVARFLRRREPMDSRPENLLIYYVGHGLFTRGDQAYCLAVRSTDEIDEGASSIRASNLAGIIKENAAFLRRFLILDCCFAASIHKEFQ